LCLYLLLVLFSFPRPCAFSHVGHELQQLFFSPYLSSGTCDPTPLDVPHPFSYAQPPPIKTIPWSELRSPAKRDLTLFPLSPFLLFCLDHPLPSSYFAGDDLASVALPLPRNNNSLVPGPVGLSLFPGVLMNPPPERFRLLPVHSSFSPRFHFEDFFKVLRNRFAFSFFAAVAPSPDSSRSSA